MGLGTPIVIDMCMSSACCHNLFEFICPVVHECLKCLCPWCLPSPWALNNHSACYSDYLNCEGRLLIKTSYFKWRVLSLYARCPVMGLCFCYQLLKKNLLWCWFSGFLIYEYSEFDSNVNCGSSLDHYLYLKPKKKKRREFVIVQYNHQS